jgi:cell division protein FtsL
MLEREYMAHPIWEVIGTVNERVQRLKSSTLLHNEERNELEPEEKASERCNEARSIMKHLEGIRAKANPALIKAQDLDKLYDDVYDVSEILTEKPEDNEDHDEFRIDILDKFVSAISNLLPLSSSWATAIVDKSANFNNLNESYINIVSESQAKLRSNFEQDIKNAKDLFVNTQADIQATKTIINTQIGELQEYVNKEALEAKRNSAKQFEKEAKDFHETVSQEIEAIRQSTGRVKDLAKDASGTLTGREYKNHAKSEKWLGIGASVAGILALLGGLWALIFMSHNLITNDLFTSNFWPIFTLKLSATLLFSAIATVCIRFGSRSLYRANEYKRQHLELVSLFALLTDEESMPAKERQLAIQARINFFNKSYGRAWDNTGKNGSDEDLGSGELVRILAEALSNRKLRS